MHFLTFISLLLLLLFFCSTVDYWQRILKALPWQYTLSHKIPIGIAHFWGGFCYHSSAWGNQAITLLNVDDSNYGFYFYKCYEYLRIVLSQQLRKMAFLLRPIIILFNPFLSHNCCELFENQGQLHVESI